MDNLSYKRSIQAERRVTELTETFKLVLPLHLWDLYCELRRAIDDYNKVKNDYFYDLGYMQGQADLAIQTH